VANYNDSELTTASRRGVCTHRNAHMARRAAIVNDDVYGQEKREKRKGSWR